METCEPIFVVGVPRSGTTLLASLLGAHRAIHAGPETHFFEAADERGLPAIRPSKSWVDRSVDWLMSIEHVGSPIPTNCGLTSDDLRAYLRTAPRSHRSLLEALVVPQMKRAGKSRWLEKTPDHLAHLPTLRKLFPESRVLRIVRDPRDTILSLREVPWGPKRVEEGIVLYADNDRPGDAFCRRDGRNFTLRFEDLVTCPEETLSRVGTWIGESLDPSADRSASSAEVNRTREPWKNKTSSRIDASRVGGWRDRLSDGDQRLIEACLGSVFDRHGYERRFYPAGHQLKVRPLRHLTRSPFFVDAIRTGSLPLHEEVKTEWLLGDTDPQSILDQPHGSRLGMLVKLAADITLKRVWGQSIVWWAEEEQCKPGRLARIMAHFLAPCRRNSKAFASRQAA